MIIIIISHRATTKIFIAYQIVVVDFYPNALFFFVYLTTMLNNLHSASTILYQI